MKAQRSSTQAKLAMAGLCAVTAIAVLASCTSTTATTQINTLNDKVVQLQKSLDETTGQQPATAAKIESLNKKIAQLEKTLAEAQAAKSQDASFAPGLGEIMGLNQMRHAKLWFAGENENWPLAEYEFVELEEGFTDIVHFHPTHDGVPQPLTEMIPSFTSAPMAALGKAIEAKDKAKFVTAFDGLTNACNSCHVAANFGFNVIMRPSVPPFTNQNFTPRP